MNIPALHSWNLTPKDAIALQKQLAGRIDATPSLGPCELVAGADASYSLFSPTFYAAIVVIRVQDGSVVETAHAVGTSPFPYIPGLLSFREAPILLEAFARLKHRPEALFIDGQGMAHPRRIGIASHVGLWLDLPTIGCAKSRLIGEFREPGLRPGAHTALRDEGEIIGRVLRTKLRTKPLFISVGHKIDLASAVRLVLKCCRGYRVPEPTRQAHLAVNELRRTASRGA
jgi:deoxyribonuclease V